MSLSSREDVLHRTTQPVHDELELLKGDALLAVLQSEQAGGRHSQLPRKHSIRHLSPPFTKEAGQVFVQGLPHWRMLDNRTFLLRNFFLEAVPQTEYSLTIAPQ